MVSPASFSDGAFLERCTIAAAKEEFLLACSTSVDYQHVRAPSRLKRLEPAYFSTSWATGLGQVVARLTALGIRPSLEIDRGRQIALGDYLPIRVTVAKPEPVFANLFALQLPKKMLIIDLLRPLTGEEIVNLRGQWAFVEVNKYSLAAFAPPPDDSLPAVKVDRIPELLWEEVPQKDGKKTFDLAKGLARRSLEIACAQKGLKFCSDRDVFYFSEHESGDWNQSIKHVDGRATTVQLTGMRTKGWGDRASPFHYQLAPRFAVQCEFGGTWNVVVRIYIRTTTPEGALFEGKEIGRRRKIVSRSWWNKEWLARLLGVVQALETSLGRIEIGAGSRAVIMSTNPLSWECPVGLDVLALSGISDIGEEIATYRLRDDDDEDSDQASDSVQKGQS